MGLAGVLDRNRAWLVAFLLALAGTAPVVAQPALYTAGGILVDITGDIATLRDQAMLQGQRQALQRILIEIAPADQVAGIALPGEDVISGWVQDFAIDEEKIAADRYIGIFTFRFQAEPIRTLLADYGISFAQTQTKQVLVVPVMTDETGTSTLWGPTNQWLAAWTLAPPRSTLMRFVLPRGDAGDVITISAVEALAGDTGKLGSLAARHGAGDVAVAEAALSPAAADGTRTLSIAVTRHGPAGAQVLRDRIVGDALAQDQLMRQGVERAAALLQDAWKQANLIDANIQGSMEVDVPVVDLKEWVAVKRQLAKVQGLRGARLISLSRSLAEMELSYIGTEEQFARALAREDLALTLSGEGQGTLKLDPNALSVLAAPELESDILAPIDAPAVPDEPALPPQ